MKWLGLVLLAAACSESGAHFTLAAPDGPETAASFKVILATPEQIPSIANQRVSPDSMATQTVPYFLQRTVAGASQEPIERVDGLRIKLEASFTMDSTFIPFVLLYDDAGAIVGVGTFYAEGQTMPSPIIVLPDEIDKYTLDVQKVTQVDDATRAASDQVQVVDCFRDDQTTFTSGIVWRPNSGGELRILFPDDGSTDATGRALDLDCDGKKVSAETSSGDCDDTRAWFYAGAQETCDGYDTNCDGQQLLVTSCAPGTNSNVCADPTTGMGIALCDDRTGQASDCQSDPQCLCANGQLGCAKCMVNYSAAMSAGNVVPCQPGIGTLASFGLCSDSEQCTVEILAVRGGWKAEVATDPQMTFGSKATNVGGRFALKVKRPEGPGAEIPGMPGHSTGEVDFAITTKDGATFLRGIDLYIGTDSSVACNTSGPYSMYCTP